MSTLALLSLLACGGSADTTPAATPTTEAAPATTTEAAPAATTTEAAPAAAAPTSGPSAEKLAAAKDAVHPFQPWAEADSALKAQIGDPMKSDADKELWWTKDGEQCQVLTVSKMGDSVGSAALETGACPQ